MGSKFIKLRAGVSKQMVWTAVKQVIAQIEDRNTKQLKDVPSLVFDVTEEDKKAVAKQYSATSKRLIEQIKKIIGENAENLPVKVELMQLGQGFDVDYVLKRIG